MAIPISSFGNFRKEFEKRKSLRDLFAFLLFDTRPSHEAIERFADVEFDWLDGLAASANIFFFIFLKRDRSEGGVINPGLEVAKMFGIRPNQMPGIVLFTLSEDKEGVSKGVYLPLETKLFSEDIDHVEEIFSDLFSVIQECREEGCPPMELLENVAKRVKGLKRKEQARPVVRYFKKTLNSLKTLPTHLLTAMAEAWAKGIIHGMPGG